MRGFFVGYYWHIYNLRMWGRDYRFGSEALGAVVFDPENRDHLTILEGAVFSAFMGCGSAYAGACEAMADEGIRLGDRFDAAYFVAAAKLTR